MKLKHALALLLAVSCAFGAAAAKYDVTVKLAGDTGDTKEVPVKQYEAGKKVTLTVTPDKGYYVTQWATGQEVYSGQGKSFSFTMPNRALAFTATLERTCADDENLDVPEPQLILWNGYSTDATKASGTVTSFVGRQLMTTFYLPAKKSSKLTAKFEGLPKGLTVTATNYLASVGTHGEVASYPAWTISGVPTEALNVTNAPLFAVLSNESKGLRVVTVPLNIREQLGYASLTQGSTLTGFRPSSLPAMTGAETTWLPKSGLPTGLKADKATGGLIGTPTKPGVYFTTYTRTKTVGGKKTTESFTVKYRVFSPTTDKALFGNVAGPTNTKLGQKGTWSFATAFKTIASPKMAGLPTGLKFDAKTLAVSGTPLKVGTFAVTLSGKSTSTQQAASYTIFWDVVAPGVLADAEFCVPCENVSGTVVGRQIDDPDSDRSRFVYAYAGSKVSASGLPAGVKLVKVGQDKIQMGGKDTLVDVYSFAGVATTAKASAVTVKVTYLGLTETLRTVYVVRPFKAAGTLYGRFAPQVSDAAGPLVAGEVIFTLAANGAAKAVFTDGKTKETVNFKNYFGSPAIAVNDSTNEGDIQYIATLPASKTQPARKLTISINTNAYVDNRTGDYGVVPLASFCACEITCDDDPAFARTIQLGLRWEEALHHELSETYEGACPHESDSLAAKFGTSAFYASDKTTQEIAGGYAVVVRDANAEKILTAKVHGRTPDGLAFTGKAVTLLWDNYQTMGGWVWSPFTVYNKATDTTWLYTCTVDAQVRVDRVTPAGYVADLFNAVGQGPTPGMYHDNLVYLSTVPFTTFPDAVSRQDWQCKSGYYHALICIYTQGLVTSTVANLGIGVPSPEIAVTYKPATVTTTFKLKDWTYEVVPCGTDANKLHGVRYRTVNGATVCEPVNLYLEEIGQPV